MLRATIPRYYLFDSSLFCKDILPEITFLFIFVKSFTFKEKKMKRGFFVFDFEFSEKKN